MKKSVINLTQSGASKGNGKRNRARTGTGKGRRIA